jgi:hypothetical protein
VRYHPFSEPLGEQSLSYYLQEAITASDWGFVLTNRVPVIDRIMDACFDDDKDDNAVAIPVFGDKFTFIILFMHKSRITPARLMDLFEDKIPQHVSRVVKECAGSIPQFYFLVPGNEDELLEDMINWIIETVGREFFLKHVVDRLRGDCDLCGRPILAHDTSWLGDPKEIISEAEAIIKGEK